MALRRNEYYWIENAKGDLRKRGRYMYSDAAPDLFRTKKQAQVFCRRGEKPIKVQLVKACEKELLLPTVIIDKKVGRDGFVYGYQCPSCNQTALYDKHLSENTVAFVCSFCGGRLMVGGVNFNDSVSDPEPFILPAGWDREE